MRMDIVALSLSAFTIMGAVVILANVLSKILT